MSRPNLEVSDILKSHLSSYLKKRKISFDQKRILKDIILCRSSTLGGHVRQCDRCKKEEISYNSCRNRHCPKCQGSARSKWIEERAKEVLDSPYFHIVFTLPDTLRALALQNKKEVYGILFKSVSETLIELCKDPKHLGAEIGFLSVLHTWGQNLSHHPHLHCVIPSGGISPCHTKWVSKKGDYFLPVQVLSRLFRGKFLYHLRESYKQGKLLFYGLLKDLEHEHFFTDLIKTCRKKEWVVYAKKPFGGPKQVLKYLSNYTHRVAISNHRLLSMKGDVVTFRAKDYKNNGQKKEVGMNASEFIRRFLLHTLPKGFMRIRHYGFLSNKIKKQKLLLCEQLISQLPIRPEEERSNTEEKVISICHDEKQCPACHKGKMIVKEIIDKINKISYYWDTS